jgi:hypothetical protein
VAELQGWTPSGVHVSIVVTAFRRESYDEDQRYRVEVRLDGELKFRRVWPVDDFIGIWEFRLVGQSFQNVRCLQHAYFGGEEAAKPSIEKCLAPKRLSVQQITDLFNVYLRWVEPDGVPPQIGCFFYFRVPIRETDPCQFLGFRGFELGVDIDEAISFGNALVVEAEIVQEMERLLRETAEGSDAGS